MTENARFDARRFDAITFLSELIAVPSCDPPGGELAVAELVYRCLQQLGIEATLDEFAPGRANVIGRLPGQGPKPALVLSAHLDTVPVGDQPWDFEPFAGDIEAGRMRGRGSADMKSAIAAFIAAAAEIKHRRVPLSGDVVLAFTAGESANCLGAKHLVAQGFQSKIGAFLCGEPSSLDIIVAEKAVLWLEAVAQGQMGHVSGAAGSNAIDLMIAFLSKLKALGLAVPAHPLLTGPSINVGRIHGGAAVNVTPDSCTAELDIRFTPGIDYHDVIAQVQAITPADIDLRLIDFKPAVTQSPKSDFIQICRRAVERTTGNSPQIKGVSYYTDGAVLLQGLDVPFAILGPGDLGASGQPNETVSIQFIQQIIEIYVEIIEKWSADPVVMNPV